MNQPPLVSVIINNFNYGRFLVQAIDSALQQTYPHVEVIVVDDGSTDHSRDIMLRYHGRIVPILKANGGQASALNAGFNVSHGDLVVFLDADDVLLPSMIKDVAGVFLSGKGIVRVQYRMAVIDELGRLTGIEKPEKHIPVPSGDVRKQALAFPFDMPWLPTSGNVFSAEALRQVMPIPEDRLGSVGADWYLVHLTSLLGRVAFLDKTEADYRIHAANHYEQEGSSVDCGHIRQTIRYCQATSSYLLDYAEQSGMVDHPYEILSVSYMANRLISLRLEPEHHPVPGDTRLGLVWRGALAASRRFDISTGLKCIFLAWFFLMAIVPKSMATILARWFLYPQERTKINSLLGRFHHKPKPPEAVPQPYEDAK